MRFAARTEHGIRHGGSERYISRTGRAQENFWSRTMNQQLPLFASEPPKNIIEELGDHALYGRKEEVHKVAIRLTGNETALAHYIQNAVVWKAKVHRFCNT